MHDHAHPDSSSQPALQHPEWAAMLARLRPGENVKAQLEVDLDARMHFARGLLVLTSERLLAYDPAQRSWAEWALRPDLAMRIHDHAGVGSLDLVDASGRLAQWRFTLQINLQAQRWQEAFEKRDEPPKTEVEELEFCPSCQAPLPPESEECPTCARELHTPPSTWVLLRLSRFAKPYQGQLLAGFLLMLGSTAATLVGPYLYQPLMDEVLIPFQQGHKIDPWLVAFYLSGLFGIPLYTGLAQYLLG